MKRTGTVVQWNPKLQQGTIDAGGGTTFSFGSGDVCASTQAKLDNGQVGFQVSFDDNGTKSATNVC